MKLWPFSKIATKPNRSSKPPAPAREGSLKWSALQYLAATLTVLRSENIPLATPVHGTPARGARFIEIPIHLDRRRVGPYAMRKVLSKATLEAIQAAAFVEQVNGWQVRNAIVYQYQLERTLWKSYKRSDLPAPQGIGIGSGRKLVEFRLTDKNVLIGGETRSGKSVAEEAILFSLMAQYQPTEVGLVIIDPNRTLGVRKNGLTARRIGTFANAAHLLRPVACTPAEIDAAINFVYHQWRDQRMPNGIQDAPAIVLVIDEMMNEAVIGDKESDNFNQVHLTQIAQLASQGIKNNIFVVAGAQDPKIGNTSGMLMRSLTRRYVGRVTDYNASRTLAGREGVNAHLLTEAGDFVEVEGQSLTRFQVAEPTREDFERLERRPVKLQPVGPVELLDSSRLPIANETPTEPLPAFDPALLQPLEPDPGGNRGVEIDMRTLAIYFYEKRLSIAQASEKYGLKRRVHELHRQEALTLVDEIKWLQAGHPSRSPYYVAATQERG